MKHSHLWRWGEAQHGDGALQSDAREGVLCCRGEGRSGDFVPGLWLPYWDEAGIPGAFSRGQNRGRPYVSYTRPGAWRLFWGAACHVSINARSENSDFPLWDAEIRARTSSCDLNYFGVLRRGDLGGGSDVLVEWNPELKEPECGGRCGSGVGDQSDEAETTGAGWLARACARSLCCRTEGTRCNRASTGFRSPAAIITCSTADRS